MFWPFKVIDFGQKHVCDFLLVCPSKCGAILHRFKDIACLCAHNPTHPNSTLTLGVFPLVQIAHVWVNLSRYLLLFSIQS